MKTSTLIPLFTMACAALLRAEPLTQSTFTELVRNVEVLVQPSKTAEPARLNEIFKAPNLVRTGPNSRAELTAPDDTITRVGANTVFSFSPAGREIDLEQGSVLFHSPHGKGGGVIKSGGASAAVTGTTLIVSTVQGSNPDQSGFKVILLEGTGTVKLKNGKSKKLKAGQLVYVLPNHEDFGPLLYINLGKLVAGSALVKGFSLELPSLPSIQNAVVQQEKWIARGGASDTGTFADNFVGNPLPPGGGSHNGPNNGDPVTFTYASYNFILNYIDGGGVPTGTTPSVPGLKLYSYPVYEYTSFFLTPVSRTAYTYNQSVYLAGLQTYNNIVNGGGGSGGGNGSTIYYSNNLRPANPGLRSLSNAGKNTANTGVAQPVSSPVRLAPADLAVSKLPRITPPLALK